MARKAKQTIVTVLPTDATPAPVADATPAVVVAIDPTPAPVVAPIVTPDPTPAAPSGATPPTPDPTPAAPIVYPMMIIDLSMIPTPAVVALPEFSAAAAPFVVEFNAIVDATFAKVATSDYAGMGRAVRSVMLAEFNATPANVWNDATYDATLTNLRDQYVMTRTVSQDATVRPGDWLKCADWLDYATTLGIVDADRVAYGLIVNTLAPASRSIVKNQAVSVAKVGWADWLKSIVPMIIDGSISRECITASVLAQRTALHTLDPKTYPKPPVKKVGAASTPAPVASVPTPAPVASKSTPAPVASSVPTPAVKPSTPAPTPATSTPAPIVNAAAAPTAIVWTSVNPTDTATIFANLAKVGTDDQIVMAYKAIVGRVKAIADRAALAQKTA